MVDESKEQQANIPYEGVVPDEAKPVGEIVNVTGDEIIQLLNSPGFKLAVNNAVGRMRRTNLGIEVGFTIMRDLHSGSLQYIQDTEAGIGSVGIGSKGYEKFSRALEAGKFPFINVHTHPVLRNLLYSYSPSGQDLISLRGKREDMRDRLGVDGNPIGVIIVNQNAGHTDMVVYQELYKKSAIEKLEAQYNKDLSTNQSLKDIIDLLQNYGYKAIIISYPLSKAKPEDIEVIKSFGFNLTPYKGALIESTIESFEK